MGPYSVSKIAVEYMCKSMAQLFHLNIKKTLFVCHMHWGSNGNDEDKNNSIPSDEGQNCCPIHFRLETEQNGAQW